MLWSAFPPLGLWLLAFAGLFLWLRLIAAKDAFAHAKSFRGVWIGSFVFWLATDFFVTMPHWAGYFGWIAMSAYLAVYFPFFFASSRALVHRFHVPLVIAAPICWVGMEWLRAHVITGFGMAMLPHAMYRMPLLIQTADIIGGYGNSFLMVFIAAATVSAWQSFPSPRRGRLGRGESLPAATSRRTNSYRCVAFITAAIAIAAFALAYGAWRLGYEIPASTKSLPVALIQGSRDVRFELTQPEVQREWLAKFRENRDLTVQARQRWPDLKLIIWPESAFPQMDLIPQSGEDQLSADERASNFEMRQSAEYCYRIGIGVAPIQSDSASQSLLSDSIPLLTGGHGYDPVRNTEFNSAFMFDRSGEICFRYHKMHLVMFGEYVPLGDLFPFVYRLMPIPGGLAAGIEPKTFDIDGLRFAPSICFESTVGHLIRRQVLQLKSAGQEPDVLVNLTNDGWFFGSNCLDLHLACNVFRAVEMRKPMLVAANTGFSAHIDGGGRLLVVGPRRRTDILRADVRPDGRTSPYLIVGDWPAIIMTGLSVAALLFSRVRGSSKELEARQESAVGR